MIFFGGALGVVALAVWIFCIVDAITAPADQVRNLPKLAWILIVLLLVDVGSIAWLVAGRPWGRERAVRVGGPRTGRAPARPSRPSNPDDDEDFLATLTQRAEEQRRRSSGDDPAGPTA